MKFIKVFKELIKFKKYVGLVDNFSIQPIFKQYNFTKGWVGQFGSIIRLNKSDVTETTFSGELNENLMKQTIVKYLEPFIDIMQEYGLYSENLAVKIERFENEETLKINKFVFAKIEFSFLWNYFSWSYIIGRSLIILLLLILILLFI